ncbi:MAG TPA: hypothetical protein IAC19_02860 [Candidatus Ventricola gallistercoris]|nr:hypothetical protein [Candidatus Ventricola gallistercoris]
MERRIIVSGGDELREYLPPDLAPGRRIRLEGAGALCTSGGQIFCACDWGDVIWRLDGRLLVPTALFAGGPGICQLCVSAGGGRLYALCADADSLLMLDAASGAPMMVNRVGVNPSAMALDETGTLLAVAGGECGEAVLLCASTLSVVKRLPMPGMVYAVALRGGMVYALSLNESLNSTLTTVSPGGIRQTLSLDGMPGLLMHHGPSLLCATHEHLYEIAPDGGRILHAQEAAGRAGRLLFGPRIMLLCDKLGESVLSMNRLTGSWRLLCENARDMATV